MVSCMEVETASLVFACISLLYSCMGSFVCVALMVYMNVLMAYLLGTTPRKVESISQFEAGISYYGLYINIGLSVTLAIVLISLIFTIILTRGLLKKKAHLVKAYFVYGITMNTITGLGALLATLIYNMQIGLLSLLGWFLYSIILVMIKRTYEKLANKKYDQFGHKSLEAEKTNA